MTDIAELGFRVDSSGIVSADQALDNLDRTGVRVAESAGAIERSNQSLMSSYGGLAAAIGALGLGAFAKETLDVGVAFDASMNNVQSKLLVTTDAMSGLRDMAKDLGSTTSFSASEAADGMGYLAQAGLDTQQIMQAMPHTLNLASAAQMDLARAADIATNIMGGFGLSVKDLGPITDVLALVSAKANTSVEELSESMKMSAPVASKMGLDMYETAAAIGQLANNGIKGSQAGMVLNNMMLQLANPVGAAADALDDLNLSSEDFYSKTAEGQLQFVGFEKALRTITAAGGDASQMIEIFGREAGPGGLALEGSIEMISGLEEALHQSGAASEMARIQMEGLPGVIKTLSSTWEGFQLALMGSGGTGIASAALTILTEAIREGTRIIYDAGEAYARFFERLNGTGSMAAAQAREYGGLYDVIRNLGDAFDSVKDFIAPVIPYLKEFGIAFAAIGGSLAAFKLVTLALGAMAAIALNPVVLGISAVAAGAVALHANWDRIPELFDSAKASFTTIVETLGDFGSKLVGGILDILPMMLDAGEKILIAIGSGMLAGIGNAGAAIGTAVQVIITTVGGLASSLVDTGLSMASEFVKSIANGLVNLPSAFADVFMESVRSIPLIGRPLADAMGDVADSATAAMSDGLSNGKPVLEQASRELAQTVPDTIKASAVDMEPVGANTSEGFLRGLVSWIPFVGDAAGDLANTVPDTVKSELVIQSPSKIMELLGDNVGEGFAIGIAGTADQVAIAAGLVGDQAVQAFERLTDQLAIQHVELTQGQEAAERMRLAMDGITGAAANQVIAQQAVNAELERQAQVSERVTDITRDLAIENAALNIELTQGAQAAEVMKHMTEGWSQADAELAVGMKSANEALRERVREAEAVKNAIQEQSDANRLQTIELTQGADAAEKARLMMNGYSEAQAENAVKTANNMQFQREFYDTLKDSLMNASSIKDVFNDMGDFMKNWLKEKIATFAANKIMLYMGFGDGGAVGGLNSLFSSVGGSASGFGGILEKVGGLFSSSGGSGSSFGGILSSIGSRFTEGKGAADGFSGIMSGLKGVFTGSSAGASSAAQSFGVLASNANAATGAMGGLGASVGATGSSAASAGSSFGVLASNGNAAAASLGSTALSMAGVAAGAGLVGYELGELLGAANSAAVGIGTGLGAAIGSIVPVIGTLAGAAIGGAIGSAFGGSWQMIEKGFDLAFENGALTGKSFEYFEKERSLWRGTATKIIYSELDSGIMEGVQSFFSTLNDTITTSAYNMGLYGAESIMQGLSVASATFSGEDAADDLQVWLDEVTRTAYTKLYESLGPATQGVIDSMTDMVDGPLDGIVNAFNEAGIATSSIIPLMDAVGVSFGDTADKSTAAAMMLSNSMGGGAAAMDTLTQFVNEFGPAGLAAGVAIDAATKSLYEWNQSIGLGGNTLENATMEMHDLIKSVDGVSTSGHSVAEVIGWVTTGMDEASGAITINTEKLNWYIEMLAKTGDANDEHVEGLQQAIEIYNKQNEVLALNTTYGLAYYQSIDQGTQVGATAAAQWDAFTYVIDNATGHVAINQAALDQYIMSLDTSTQAGQAAYESAMALGDAFGVTKDGAILTSEALYEYAKAQDWSTEAGQQAALAAIEQADALRIVEEASRQSVTSMHEVNDIMGAIGLRFDETAPSAVSTSDALIELMGGLEGLKSATESYFSTFYSLEEQQSIQLAQAAAAVLQFNESLGLTGAAVIDSKEEFRAYVESLNLTTEAGRNAFASAMEVSQAMGEVVNAGDSLNAVIATLPDNLNGSFTTMVVDAQAAGDALVNANVAANDSVANLSSTVDNASVSVVTAATNMDLLGNAANDSAADLAASTAATVESSAALVGGIAGISSDASVAAEAIRLAGVQIAEAGGASGVSLTAFAESVRTTAMDAQLRGEELRQSLSNSLTAIISDAGISGNDIVNTMLATFDQMVSGVDTSGGQMRDSLASNLATMLSETGSSGAALTASLMGSFDAVVADATTSGSELRNTLQADLSAIVADAGSSGAGLVSTLMQAFDTMVSSASTGGVQMRDTLAASLNAIVADSGASGSQLVSILMTAFDAMSGNATSAAAVVGSATTAAQGDLARLSGGVDDLGYSSLVAAGDATTSAARVAARMADIASSMIGSIDSIGKATGALNSYVKSANGTTIIYMTSMVTSVTRGVDGVVKQMNRLVSSLGSLSYAASTSSIIDGSHAMGLTSVPYDGYIAELHKGERVLTAYEAQQYNQSSNESSFSAPISSPKLDDRLLMEMQAMRKEIERLRSDSNETGYATTTALGSIAYGTNKQTEVLKEVQRDNDRLNRKIGASSG